MSEIEDSNNGVTKLSSGDDVLYSNDGVHRSRKNPFNENERVGYDGHQEKIEDAIRNLLNSFDVNWEDPNYTNTPKRVAKAYIETWASGYGRDPREEFTVFPNTSGSDDLVMVKDIKFYSLCSHHLAPIEGYAAIAYVPNESLIGLSKLGRILEIYARRFQLQERIGAQTADALMDILDPKGVMVVLYNVKHGCMSSRGVKLHEGVTTTSAIRGNFKESAELRNETMNLIRTT